MSSKESIRIGLQIGKYMLLEKPQSDATWWNNFHRIKDVDDKIIDYVQCIQCKKLFSYELVYSFVCYSYRVSIFLYAKIETKLLV